MADTNITPQPSQPSPLSISFKGAFSTRKQTKNVSLYNYVHDKLNHIKFLGIGTHSGRIVPDLLRAVLVKIDGAVDEQVYRMERDGKQEGMVGEALSGVDSIDSNKGVMYGFDNATRAALTQAGVDIEDLSFTKSVKATDVAGLMQAVRNKEKEGLLQEITMYRKLDATADVAELVNVQRNRIKMASALTDTIITKKLGEGTEIRADESAVRFLIKSASLLDASASIVEKVAAQAITVALEEFKLVDHGYKAEILHYLLMSRTQYRTAIHAQIAKFVEGYGVKAGDILDTYDALAEKLLSEFSDTVEYTEAVKILYGQDGLSTLAMEKMIENAVGGVAEGLQMERRIDTDSAAPEVEEIAGRKTSVNYASIDFDHNLQSAESVAFKAILDGIYNDFQRTEEVNEVSNEYLEPIRASKVSRDSLIDLMMEVGSKDYSPQIAEVLETVIGGKAGADEGVLVSDLMFNEVHNTREFVVSELIAVNNEKGLTGDVLQEVRFNKLVTNEFTLPDYTPWFEMSDSDDQELNVLMEPEYWAEMMDRDFPLLPDNDEGFVLGEISEPENSEITVLRDLEEILAELDSSDHEDTPALMLDVEVWGELSSDRGDDNYVPPEQEVLAQALEMRVAREVEDGHEIAVLSCSPPDWSFRNRPPLPLDSKVPEPVFEHVCDQYVCEDWLHFPLIDFTGDTDDMYDGNCKPRFPTGEYDQEGNPYILPPYTILNEPVGNGEVVGGQEIMAINPCNLYDVINYIIKVYDAYKGRFAGSSPVDSMSRVLNMTYTEIKKLVDVWDGTQSYKPDEMWRIYRFIRWIAIGVTNRFYKIKLVYHYGDLVETFENPPPTELLSYDGAIIRTVGNYTKVLDGHPILESQTNTASIDFKVPPTRSSVLSFDMGNLVPDRPNRTEQRVFINENFEGAMSDFAIKGTGWTKVTRQGGGALAVQDTAIKGVYRTTSFTIDAETTSAVLRFSYGIDSNMEGAYLALAKEGSGEVWRAQQFTTWASASVNVTGGRYYFVTNVPQSETGSLIPMEFTTQRIQNEWSKVGYQTQWVVSGNTIYEEENTGGVAMVINEQWKADSDYIFEGEFMTSGSPTGLEDWIGFIFNYKSNNQYYAVGSYGETSPGIADGNYSGVWKSQLPYENVPPTWKFSSGDLKWKYNVWYKIRIEVTNGRSIKIYVNGTKVLDVTDPNGWTGGASGLGAYSNPNSTFRNIKYYTEPRFDAFIDNVMANGEVSLVTGKPEYLIDFYLDDTVTPSVADYSNNAKSTFSFPILDGEHKAKWVFKKRGSLPSIATDASFVDNILIKNVVIVGCHTEEEFIGCGGHFAVKWLIDNLLEYYRRHHEACKGRRDIWIIE